MGYLTKNKAAPKPEKNKSAQELGSLGGKARAAKLTAAQRKEGASKAAKARWAKRQTVKP